MRRLLLSLAVVIASLALTSCEEGEKDYVPVTFAVYVSDAEGNDLLDPSVENNLTDRGITLAYKGVEYRIDKTDMRDHEMYYATRVYMTQFTGGYIERMIGDKFRLVIGEWMGDCRWEDETVTINWPDGTKNELSFTLKKRGWTNAAFYLDGKKNGERNVFRLVK